MATALDSQELDALSNEVATTVQDSFSMNSLTQFATGGFKPREQLDEKLCRVDFADLGGAANAVDFDGNEPGQVIDQLLVPSGDNLEFTDYDVFGSPVTPLLEEDDCLQDDSDFSLVSEVAGSMSSLADDTQRLGPRSTDDLEPCNSQPGFGIDIHKWSLQPEAPKFFWETDSFLGSIFGGSVEDAVSLKRPADYIPVPDVVEGSVEDAFQACKHMGKSGICDISFKYVEHKADHDKRHSMSSNWASLVCMNLEAFTIGDAVLLSGKGVSHRLVVESVSACMARKATSTITKRFYALNRFVGYCGKSGLQCFPILERVMFEYLQFLAKDEKSAPSSGRSFLEAVNFACATLGLRSDLAVLGTRRIDGVSAELVKRGDPIEQASPLTVSQVIQLERMTAQAADMRDRIVLEGLLILLYGCARVSDGQRVHSYILDADLAALDPTSLDEQGYFEMQVLGCKTARTETLRRLFLPVVAPIYDLGSSDWFRSRLGELWDWKLKVEPRGL